MKVAFFTLGCKVNQYETQAMREEFIRLGYTCDADSKDFNIAVINSCTVTAESDRKTRQLLHKIRRKNENAVIVLTGCMVQAFSGEAKELIDADIVVGNKNVGLICELVGKFLKTGEKIFSFEPHKKGEGFNTLPISQFAERTRAYMKIEDGCDRYCSYCIIPYARGFVRSRAVEDIRTEAERLAQKGYLEVVLVGINLSAYGKGTKLNLCDAVDAVCSVEGIKRVRLGSLEPDHITDDMLERLKMQEKFCPQFHLSLQSGCDETLKRMNRHYDSAFYADLVGRIRKMFPDSAITTDIMVGFAGESEEEFEKSLQFFKGINFAKAHVFSYSRRKGTVAYNLSGQISNKEKARRSGIMLTAAAKSEQAFLENQVGKTLSVLFESYENGRAFGYAENYVRVCVNSSEALDGKIKTVKITTAQSELCFGEIN